MSKFIEIWHALKRNNVNAGTLGLSLVIGLVRVSK